MDDNAQEYINRAWTASSHNMFAAVLAPDGTVAFSPGGFQSLRHALHRPLSLGPQERLVQQEHAEPLTAITLCVDSGSAFHLWCEKVTDWEGALVLGAAPAPQFLTAELALAQAIGACATAGRGQITTRVVDSAMTALWSVLSFALGQAGVARGQALVLGLSPDHAALRYLRHLAARVGARPDEPWKGLATVAASLLNIASALDALHAAMVAHLVAGGLRSLTSEWPLLIREPVTGQIADLALAMDKACAEAFEAGRRQDDEAAVRALAPLDTYAVRSDGASNDNRQ